MGDIASDVGRMISTRVSEWAASNRVPIVTGFIDEPGEGESTPILVHLVFDEGADEGAELVALLERVRPSLLVVEQAQLEPIDIDSVLEDLEARDASRDLVEHARSFRQYLGFTSSYSLRIFSREFPVSLSYMFTAEWYTELMDTGVDHEQLDAEDAAQRERWQAAQRDRERWTAATRSAAARRVAEDSRFSQAKTEAARVFIARDVLGAEAPENEFTVKQIGREAKAIFDLEIKPHLPK